MDGNLKLLADVSLAVTQAEAAADDGAFHLASECLDAAREGLAGLRERWPEMSATERRLVGATGRPVRQRLDAVAARVPKLRAVTEMPAPVVDPEQEVEPEAA